MNSGALASRSHSKSSPSTDVGTAPERAQESLDVLFAELQRIQTPAGRVERDEFDRAIVSMKSRLVFSGESTGARAGAIAGDWHRIGRARSLEEMATEIDPRAVGVLPSTKGTLVE